MTVSMVFRPTLGGGRVSGAGIIRVGGLAASRRAAVYYFPSMTNMVHGGGQAKVRYARTRAAEQS
jgi:hypothetical protein